MPVIKNLDKTLIDLNNETIKQKNGDLTFKDVYKASLLFLKDGETISGEQHLKRYEMAMELALSNGELDVSIDDLKMLKDLIPRAHWVPLIGGQAIKNLEEV